MCSYVRYSMHGFNQEDPETINNTQYRYTLTNNAPHKYSAHPFLESVFINDSITEITFFLLPGKSAEEYLKEIGQELERVCFNLIVNSELPIIQPCCLLKSVVDKNGSEVDANIHDAILVTDEVFMRKTVSASSIYDCIHSNNRLSEKHAQYKELFWILHSPHNVIRFMGLYDIMAGLISNPISQKNVCSYFGKNKEKYPFVSFLPSLKNPKNKEDSFTHLRNAIAHSKQVGVDEYIEISEQISDTVIKRLLIVINDLLCE